MTTYERIVEIFKLIGARCAEELHYVDNPPAEPNDDEIIRHVLKKVNQLDNSAATTKKKVARFRRNIVKFDDLLARGLITADEAAEVKKLEMNVIDTYRNMVCRLIVLCRGIITTTTVNTDDCRAKLDALSKRVNAIAADFMQS